MHEDRNIYKRVFTVVRITNLFKKLLSISFDKFQEFSSNIWNFFSKCLFSCIQKITLYFFKMLFINIYNPIATTTEAFRQTSYCFIRTPPRR